MSAPLRSPKFKELKLICEQVVLCNEMLVTSGATLSILALVGVSNSWRIGRLAIAKSRPVRLLSKAASFAAATIDSVYPRVILWKDVRRNDFSDRYFGSLSKPSVTL